MTQRNHSSYLPIFYISVVVFSFFVIHLSELANLRRHQQEMRDLEFVERSKKSKKKSQAKKTKPKKVKPDTIGQVQQTKTIKPDSVATLPKSKSDETFFSELLDEYSKKNGNEGEVISPRTDLVIRYYKKKKDGGKVYKLRDLGFYIHERPSEVVFDNFASNAIFYGDSVKKEDLILIAYHLLNNGVELRSITLSKYHDAWKSNSVEIGTDTTVSNNPVFTLSTLRKKWKAM